MERRKFTREFKLEAVRLIKERGVSCPGVAGPWCASVAVARLGEEVRRGCGPGLSWPRPDEARTARDRASQARGGQRRVGSMWLLLSISFPAALSAGR